jgi:predicted ABC-type ATPase
VLSTDKYRRLVVAAKRLGFEVRLTYVVLDSPERSIERVKLRVAKGGHAVSERKIVDRYSRSLAQLPWFLEQANQASIFDNSGAEPTLIAQKKDGVITLDPGALPQMVVAVKRTATE